MEKVIFVLALVFGTKVAYSRETCKVLAECNEELTWKTWIRDPVEPLVLPSPDGDPGSSLLRSEGEDGPQLYYFTNTMTWDSGKRFCRAQGRRLCNERDLCVAGNIGRRFLFDVIPGDNWVPIIDAYNDWVEIGDSDRRTCYRHNSHYGPPPWGISTTSAAHKGYLFCCMGTEEQEPASIRYQYIGPTATYASSKSRCTRQGLRLCSSVEVCRKNKPVFGVIRGDMWVAVNDRTNEWVEVGDSHGRTCWIHGVHYGPPPWGIRTDETQLEHVGYVYCCEYGNQH